MSDADNTGDARASYSTRPMTQDELHATAKKIAKKISTKYSRHDGKEHPLLSNVADEAVMQYLSPKCCIYVRAPSGGQDDDDEKVADNFIYINGNSTRYRGLTRAAAAIASLIAQQDGAGAANTTAQNENEDDDDDVKEKTHDNNNNNKNNNSNSPLKSKPNKASAAAAGNDNQRKRNRREADANDNGSDSDRDGDRCAEDRQKKAMVHHDADDDGEKPSSKYHKLDKFLKLGEDCRILQEALAREISKSNYYSLQQLAFERNLPLLRERVRDWLDERIA